MMSRREISGFLFGVSLAFFCSTVAFAADDCATTPDLSKDLGVVHDQECSNWCGYFTATDMLTQKMRKTGHLKNGERVHPLMVASATMIHEDKTPDPAAKDGGSPVGAFLAISYLKDLGNKVCREGDLSPETGLKNPIFTKSSQELKRLTDNPPPAPEGENFCDAPSKLIRERLSSEVFAAARGTWVSSLREACKTETPVFKWWNQFDEPRYKELMSKNPPPIKPKLAADFRGNIDNAFKLGTLPAVLFNAKFLHDPKRKRSAKDLECNQAMSASKVGSMHWATLVARRRNVEGVCEYKLRNSTGKSCEGYLKPEKCEDGYHWIPRDVLEEKMANVQYLL